MLGSKSRNTWLQTLLVVGVVIGFGLGRLAYAQTPPADAPADPPAPPADAPAAGDPAPADPAPADPAPADPAPGDPAAEEPPAEEPPAEEPPAEEPPAEEPPAEPMVDEPVEEPAADEPADDDVEEITVTGSAIRRRDLVTPAPVSILDRVELDAAGMVSIGDILQNLTAQSNAINVQSNNGGDGSTRINLRGIGTGRTLVLVNGRRHVAGGTGADASVDLNAIPAAIIKRIEVLKDGASAVYGSDAIGGVVNIITRTDFEGTEATVYTAGTESGGSIMDISVTTGHSSDKGNIVFSAGYYKQNPMWTFERPNWATPDKSYDWATYGAGQAQGWTDRVGVGGLAESRTGCHEKLTFDTENDISGLPSCVSSLGSSATPQGTIIDRLGEPGNQAWQDIVGASAGGDTYFNDPSVGWRDFRGTGNFDTNAGDFYNYQPANYLITPQERYNVFSTGNFKLHDYVRGYFEASYTNRTSNQKLAATPLFIISEELTVSADNFYNPFARNFIDVRRRFLEASNRKFLQDLDTFRFVGGFDGELPIPFGSDWKWDVAYNFGRTQGTSINEGRFVRSRVEAAIGPSFVDAAGGVQCGTPGNPIAGCVPLNLFGGPGTITQDMLDYIQYTGIARGFSELQLYTAGVTGKLGEIPFGGDIGLAVGIERRQQAGGFTPDPITASGDTTGNKGEATGGSYSSNEAYAELNLVLLEDMPGVDTLELVGAVRGFDYDNFGGGTTWKVGGRWQIVPDLAVRGTRSTAFRAPSIGSLFSGVSDSFPLVTDPCNTDGGTVTLDPTVAANCAIDGLDATYTDTRSQLKTRIGGNPDLDPETADTWTIGAVFEPKALKGFTLTLDYYHIAVQKTISTLGINTIFDNCYRSTDRTNCGQVNRNAQGLIIDVEDTVQNIGSLKTAGLDIFLRYDYKAPFGKMRFTLDTTWLQKFNIRDAGGKLRDGKGVFDLGVFPAIKSNLGVAWVKDDLGAGLNVRYIGGYVECENDVCKAEEGMPIPTRRDVDANITADVYASYALDLGFGETKLTLGVNNVLDQDPPRIYNGFSSSTDTSTYDFLGRFFYLRLSQTL